jgi:hypothetical protein
MAVLIHFILPLLVVSCQGVSQHASEVLPGYCPAGECDKIISSADDKVQLEEQIRSLQLRLAQLNVGDDEVSLLQGRAVVNHRDRHESGESEENEASHEAMQSRTGRACSGADCETKGNSTAAQPWTPLGFVPPQPVGQLSGSPIEQPESGQWDSWTGQLEGLAAEQDTCGYFGCQEEDHFEEADPMTFDFEEITVDLRDYDSVYGIKEPDHDYDETLEFLTTQRAVQHMDTTARQAFAEQIDLLSKEMVEVQRVAQEAAMAQGDFGMPFNLTDDPAEFVDSQADDWLDRIRVVRPGLDDSVYILGRNLELMFYLLQQELGDGIAQSLGLQELLDMDWNPFADAWNGIKKVGAAVGNVAKSVGNAVGNAAKSVVNGAKNVVGGVVNTVKKAASGLTFFVDIGKGIINVIKKIMSFINCLNNLPEKYKLIGMIKFAAGAAGKPGGLLANFIPDAWKTYMDPFVIDTTAFIKNELTGGDESLKTDEDIATQIWKKVQAFAKVRGMEGFKCIEENLLTPAFHAASGVLTRFANLVTSPLKKLFNSMMTTAGGFVSKLVDMVTKQVPALKRVKPVAEKQAALYCVGVIKGDHPKNEPKKKKLALIGTQTLAVFIKEFFDEMTNKFLAPILQKALNFIEALVQNGLHALDGLCGLIPEAGAAVCALVGDVIGGGQGLAARSLMKAGLKFIQDQGHKFIDQAAKFVAAKADKALDINVAQSSLLQVNGTKASSPSFVNNTREDTTITIPAELKPFLPIINKALDLIYDEVDKSLGTCDAGLKVLKASGGGGGDGDGDGDKDGDGDGDGDADLQ